MLQVEDAGKILYANPDDEWVFYLTPYKEFFSNLLSYRLITKISQQDFEKISIKTKGFCKTNQNIIEKYNGRFLEVENKEGGVWYVYPIDGCKYFLGDYINKPNDQFHLIKAVTETMLGISNDDLFNLKIRINNYWRWEDWDFGAGQKWSIKSQPSETVLFKYKNTLDQLGIIPVKPYNDLIIDKERCGSDENFDRRFCFSPCSPLYEDSDFYLSCQPQATWWSRQEIKINEEFICLPLNDKSDRLQYFDFDFGQDEVFQSYGYDLRNRAWMNFEYISRVFNISEKNGEKFYLNLYLIDWQGKNKLIDYKTIDSSYDTKDHDDKSIWRFFRFDPKYLLDNKNNKGIIRFGLEIKKEQKGKISTCLPGAFLEAEINGQNVLFDQ